MDPQNTLIFFWFHILFVFFEDTRYTRSASYEVTQYTRSASYEVTQYTRSAYFEVTGYTRRAYLEVQGVTSRYYIDICATCIDCITHLDSKVKQVRCCSGFSFGRPIFFFTFCL